MVGEMVSWVCAGTGAPVCPGQYVLGGSSGLAASGIMGDCDLLGESWPP